MLTRKQAIENYKLSLKKKTDYKNNDVIDNIVKQETINHNKAISETNKAIRELKNKSDKLNASTEKRVVDIEKGIVGLRADVTNIIKHSDYIVAKFDEIARNKNTLVEKAYDRVAKLENDVDKLCNIKKAQEDKIRSLEEANNKILEKICKISSNQQVIETNIKHKVDKTFDRLRNDVLNQPSKAEEVKKELQEKLAMYNLDVEGVFKEIESLKKNVFIADKKIEDLYTNITKRKS